MRRLVWALPALLSTFVPSARADVGAVDIRVADDRGSFLLRVTVTAFESGTFVLPIGTVVSTGDASVQDLVIGEDVRFEVDWRRVIQTAVWAHLRGERAPRLDWRDIPDAEHDLPGATPAIRESATRKRPSSNRS